MCKYIYPFKRRNFSKRYLKFTYEMHCITLSSCYESYSLCYDFLIKIVCVKL